MSRKFYHRHGLAVKLSRVRALRLQSDHLMRFMTIPFAWLIVALAAAPAAAQRRVPAAGVWAAGASIGATVPAESDVQNGLDVAGTLEGYLTPRVSVRAQVGATWWDIAGRGFSGTVTPVFFDGNVVYNWEGGEIHPYVTAGIGAYRFHSSIDPHLEGADTKVGVDIGGGIEYFFTRRAAITGELLYHKVDGFASPVAAFGDGSFWSFAMGAKKYF